MRTKTNKLGYVRAGFDITSFGQGKIGATAFLAVLIELGLPKKAKRVLRPGRESDPKPFMFKKKGLRIITANNPLTGKYYSGQRRDELGYAAYIGVTGTPDEVKKACAAIKAQADYIKEFDPHGRQFI